MTRRRFGERAPAGREGPQGGTQRRGVPGFQGRALTQCRPHAPGRVPPGRGRGRGCQGVERGAYGAPAACVAPGVGGSEPDVAPVLRLGTRWDAHTEPDGGGSDSDSPAREGRRQTRAPRPRPGPQDSGTPSPPGGKAAAGGPGVCPAAAPGSATDSVGSGQAGPRGGSGQRRWGPRAGEAPSGRRRVWRTQAAAPPRPTVERGTGGAAGAQMAGHAHLRGGKGRWPGSGPEPRDDGRQLLRRGRARVGGETSLGVRGPRAWRARLTWGVPQRVAGWPGAGAGPGSPGAAGSGDGGGDGGSLSTPASGRCRGLGRRSLLAERARSLPPGRQGPGAGGTGCGGHQAAALPDPATEEVTPPGGSSARGHPAV